MLHARFVRCPRSYRSTLLILCITLVIFVSWGRISILDLNWPQYAEPEPLRPACSPKHIGRHSDYAKTAYSGSHDPNCQSYQTDVTVHNGTIRLAENVSCHAYIPVHNAGDAITLTPIGRLQEGQKMPAFFLKVTCRSGVTGLASGYRNETFAQSKLNKLKPSNLNLNIMMIGFDSTSSLGALMHLNRSFDYFFNEMDGTLMEGMNIVGDGTPQALIPMFTAKTEVEMPSTRRDDGSRAQYVDDAYPFIFKEFNANGYITSYIERFSKTGTFQMRLKGFRHPPVDFYSYPYFTQTEKNYKLACFQNKTELQYNADLHKEILLNYPDVPKFLFAFQQSTHDSASSLGSEDKHLLPFLKFLNTPDIRNNTIVILMSDHGPRFGTQRKFYEGKLEERNSLFSISLPPWVKAAHPYAYQNMLSNARNRLLTPFDVHATFRHMLYGFPTERAQTFDRSISMFHEMPRSRTCADAGVAAHWCTCMDETPLNLNSEAARNAAGVVVNYMNSLIKGLSCEKQQLRTIVGATELRPNEKLVKFSGNTDAHGFEYGFKDNTQHTTNLQLKLITSPRDYLYEATLTVHGDGKITVDTHEISLISRYGRNADCVVKSHPNLRQYCICTAH